VQQSGICTLVTSTLLPTGYATNGLGSHWTLIFDDEFNKVFATPSGLDPSKWATGWGTTDNGGLTWPVPGESSDPNAWAICDPAMSVVASGTVDGRTGSFLWQSVAYKPQTDVDSSNYAQSSVQSNPAWGNTTWGASPGAQFTPEIYVEASIWTSTSSNGEMYNWPSFWLASQDDPTTGEIDVLEGLGGSPCYHWHNGSSGPGGCANGSWVGWHTYGAHWTSTDVDYFYDGTLVGSITSGILSDPMYIVLSMGYPAGSAGNNWTPTVNASGPSGFGQVPQQVTDYVRVWSP
jgi:Glycosyl hydrolases family 16